MRSATRVLQCFVLTSVLYAGEPPAPRAVEHAERVCGVEVGDPYRWMEDGDSDFESWARAEANHARAVLESIEGRATLRERVKSLDVPSGGVTELEVRGDRWIYRRSDGTGAAPALYVRKGRDGAERKLDLLGLLPASDGPWSEVSAARVLSPDGRYLTFGTTQKGEANPSLRVYDLERRRLLPDVVHWPLWADSNGFRPRWHIDSRGFFYVRRGDASAEMDNTARARRGQIFFHRLGTPVTEDAPLFGFGQTPEITETDTLYVQGEPHERWLDIWRRMPDGLETWIVDLAKWPADPTPSARKIATSDVRLPGSGIRGDFLYTAEASGAPRFRVVRYDLRTAVPEAEEVLAQQDGVVTALVVAKDAAYAVESVLSRANLHVIGDEGVRRIALDGGAVDSIAPGVEGHGVWLTQVDWLSPERGRLLDAGAAVLVDPGFTRRTPAVKRSPYVSEVAWATARDGERIPFTIVRNADLPRDGSAYVMLDGYGCFGSADPPFYWPALEAWLERGGVFVRAAMRGGGELGADWHRAGRDRNKPAAFEDAIDVAKELIRSGVTRPGLIGVTGGSCGGMTMGLAALEAPHLIGAAVLSVGAFDLLRMANMTAAGARSVRDVGDPETAEGVRRIVALSPYYQVLDGATRPSFLIGSGATDYTIPLWVGGKMVARLRAALPDGKPVFWNIAWEGGHNAGVDYVELDTDQMSFLFWQLGHPEFQPKKHRWLVRLCLLAFVECPVGARMGQHDEDTKSFRPALRVFFRPVLLRSPHEYGNITKARRHEESSGLSS